MLIRLEKGRLPIFLGIFLLKFSVNHNDSQLLRTASDANHKRSDIEVVRVLFVYKTIRVLGTICVIPNLLVPIKTSGFQDLSSHIVSKLRPILFLENYFARNS